MSDKLQELTNRLYNDGVEKAREEAAAILADAETRKEEIIKKAEADAKVILEKGTKDVESLRSRMDNEVLMAGRQAEETLKQRLTGILTDATLETGITGALSEIAFMKDLISTVTNTWAATGTVSEISLILSENQKSDFEAGLKSTLSDSLGKGLELQFTGKMKSGFKVVSKDGSYKLSFTEEDFAAFFRSFVKEATRAALFGEK